MKRKLKTILMGFLVLCGLAAQAKTVVNYPTVESKPYTGSEQTPTVPGSPDYDVISASSGTGVGGYDIYLALTDSDNTKWPDTDEEVGTMKWYITKAANAWTTEPSIESWTYDDPASTPVAAAKFGTPTVTFSGTAKDGTTYTDVTSVAKAGTYTCKFTVAGTDNYEGLDPVVKNFEIKVAVPGGGGGGSGNVNISVTGYDGPYDGSDHQINVSITGDDAPTFSVGYSETQEGPFQSDNSFKYKEIGTHTVWYRLQSVNYATVTNSAVVKISQREISPPTIASKEYNGEPQSADVTETADYSVEYNGTFTDAGTHENAVVLALKDSVHCKWADGAEDPVLLSFTITKSSGNVWLTEPSITGWKYGESAHVPVAVPKYGVVSVLYDGTTTDGGEIKDATAVSKAGSYTAKFTVPETTSYNGLSKNVTFEIERGKIDIGGGGGGSGGAKLEVGNYTGTYDGDEHTASIAVTGDASSSFVLTYSLAEAGPYTLDKPTFSNACETTKIWYSVSSPDYQTITNYATVAIDKRKVTFTSGTLSRKYDSTPLVCSLVTVSGTFAKSEGFSFDVTGSQTDYGKSKNTFTYAPKAGTLESNYEITKSEGDLEVTKRSVTLTSATDSKKYTGTALTAKTVTVTGDGWAGAEDATYDVTGSQTIVGTSKNTFSYALKGGAKEQNYSIDKVEGDLTVSEGDIVFTAQDYSAEYDGNGHSIGVTVTTPVGLKPKYALAQNGVYSESIPLYTNACKEIVVWYALEAQYYASVTNSAKVTITKRPLAAGMVDAIVDQTYTGSELKPALTFTDEGNRKITTDDYTAVYSNNKNVGLATVTVTATQTGNYSGEVTVHFNIVKANYDMSKTKWSSDAGFIYDGTEKSVTVSGLPSVVTVASYANNRKTHANTYTASVMFAYDTANYNKPLLANKKWTIGKRSVTIKSRSDSKPYDETPLVNKNVDVASGSFVGTEGLVYTVTGSQTAVGESDNEYTYAFKSNTLESDYTITKQCGKLKVVAGGIAYTAENYNAEYDGDGHSIVVKVTRPAGMKPKYALSQNGAYSESLPLYTNVCQDVIVWYALEASSYVSVTNSAKVTITKRPLTAGMVNAIDDQTYTGSELKPALTFTDEGNRKITSEDYTAVYSNNKNVGQATVTITATRAGNYSGTVTVNFKIVKATYDMSGAAWDYTTAFTYDKTEKTVTVTGLPAGVTVKAIADGKKTHAGDYVAKVTFNYDSANYNEPKLADCPWKINKKALAVTADAKTQTFGKAELPLTYKAPALCSGDTLSGSLVRDPGTNVGKYAIKQGTLANADYAITFMGAIYEIVKAKIGDGDEPGGGSVPPGGVSKFDKTFEYDGKGHTIDTNEIVKAFNGVIVGDFEICYRAGGPTSVAAADATERVPPVWTNVCVTSVWYKVTSLNYDDFVHEVRLTITARDIAKATIAPIPDVTYADKPATPVPVVTDGTPSIITANDYAVSYLNNTKPGKATVTLTGKGNYTGLKSTTFVIKSAGAIKCAALKGTLAWKLNLGSGCYTAQLKLTCTNGLQQGISTLRFIYQDRTSGSAISSALYNSSARTYRPTVSYSGTTYRYVDLDASKITAENVAVLYGVKDVSQAKGVISASECLIELYVKSLASPVSDLGYVVWTSNGAQCMMPITASSGSQGMTVKNTLKVAKMAASASMLSAPLSMNALNTSMALGVVIDPASSPYCKLTDFTVGEGGISGRVEVGKESAAGEVTQGALGANARAILMGARNLTDGFSEIGSVPVDDSGAFQFYLGSDEYSFFKVKVEVEDAVE